MQPTRLNPAPVKLVFILSYACNTDADKHYDSESCYREVATIQASYWGQAKALFAERYPTIMNALGRWAITTYGEVATN